MTKLEVMAKLDETKVGYIGKKSVTPLESALVSQHMTMMNQYFAQVLLPSTSSGIG